MSPANQIRTLRNTYDFYQARYNASCGVERMYTKEMIDACRATKKAGDAADPANKAAGIALGIGGKFPLQLADAKAKILEFERVAKGLR
ncbi:MAG: hypothetical protein EPN91_02085 [Salinibacterium sp.]|nr:MAG: hypothetical protein EPN91_02085 [Salinibacterium sp.]